MTGAAGGAIGRRVRILLCCLWPALSLAAEEPIFFRRLDPPLAEDSISYPRAVAADLATGEIFVCDTRANRIVIFDPDAVYLHQIPGGDTFSAPLDLAVDPEGYLLLLANHEGRRALIELDFDGLFLRELELGGLPGGSLVPRLDSIALSPAGDRLYALDLANLLLLIADRQGSVLAIADLAAGRSERERGDLIFGKLDVYGDRVLLAVASEGLIQTYDLDGKPLGELGIQGTAACRLAFPAAAALEENGDLVIVDQQRMVILRWRPEGNRCLSEHYGIGAAPGYLYYPMDLALDRSGRIYVAQGYEGRVQGYEGLTPPPVAAVSAPGEGARATAAGVAELEKLATQPDPARLPEQAALAVQGLEPRELPAQAAPAGPSAPGPEEAEPEAVVPAVQPEASPPVGAEADSEPAAPEAGRSLVEGALLSVERAPRYDASYVPIPYPGGDVGLDRGAAVDLVVRAFRHAGIDLQQAVHEDRLSAPDAYGGKEPDPSIGHRRLSNLAVFFRRHASSLPADQGADWQAGDLVLWDATGDGRADHVGVLAAETGPSGELLVAHHHRPDGEFDGKPATGDVLFRWPVAEHFRWKN